MQPVQLRVVDNGVSMQPHLQQPLVALYIITAVCDRQQGPQSSGNTSVQLISMLRPPSSQGWQYSTSMHMMRACTADSGPQDIARNQSHIRYVYYVCVHFCPASNQWFRLDFPSFSHRRHHSNSKTGTSLGGNRLN